MPRWIILVIFSVVTSIIGTIITKRWVITHQSFLFLLSLFFYTLSTFLWMWALKFERLTIVEAYWGTIVLILTIAIGLFLYREHLGLTEIIGVTLAVIAAILLTIK